MRIKSGLDSLDKLMDGGFPSNTVTLLSGGPGTGKTLLGLNFLTQGASLGEKCYFLSVSERKEDLIRACEGIESLKKAKNYLGKNMLIETIPIGDKVNLDYFIELFSNYPCINRLVIDNINKLLLLTKDEKEYRIKLGQIVKYLKERVECTLIICETENNMIDTGNGEAFDCDGVINVSFSELEEKPTRTLQIHKMRYTAFEPRVGHELSIDGKGMKITSKNII